MKHRGRIFFSCKAFALVVIAGLPSAQAKDSWPIKKFEFTYAGKSGWKPASAKVKEGSEVQIKLKNPSGALACFGVFDKAGKDISGGACAQARAEKSLLFFANFPKGKYTMRSIHESAGVGTFVIE